MNETLFIILEYLTSRLLSRNVIIKIYKTKLLRVVSYGCETRSLTFREEHRLRVFDNRVLSRIIGHKRDELMGGWRKINNEELHSSYSLPDIVEMIKSRWMRWADHVARMGYLRNAYKFWLEGLNERDHSNDLGVDRRIILKWILGK
jgi:hypothetical protein